MRHVWLVSLLIFSFAASAADTLRVGQRVLSVGDSAIRTTDLLGTPAFKEPIENRFGAYRGERWQYRRDNGHVVVVTIVSGKVASIEDRLGQRD